MHGKPGNRRAVRAGEADRDPAHAAGSGLVTDLKAASVAVEVLVGARIVRPAEGRLDADVHDDQASCGSLTGASRFLTGLVTCFATHDGIPAVARAASRR